MEVKNKKAYYDYFIETEIEAGIVLTGTEIKSIRKGSVDLKDSYARIRHNEAEIINMYIAKYDKGNRFNRAERRTRKLLLHKEEIKRIQNKIVLTGYSLIPLKLYLKDGYAKILLGICKGKKNYDKREVIKARDLERENKQQF